MAAPWKAFPHPSKAFDHPGDDLATAWPRLHRGDCEPFPDHAAFARLVAAHPRLKPKIDLDAAAAAVAEAWRAYHRGAFEEAVNRGLAVGPLGWNAANKAANIHATHLETDEAVRIALFEAVVARAEELQTIAPNLANGFYFQAQALGRWSQAISIAAALARGFAGRVRASLDQTLALAPRHADAHIALGTYHAEIIAKVGGLIGRLTYGADKDAGVKHFETALALDPTSAVARIEFADGLVKMYGASKMNRALALYGEAAALDPADAMERLDVEQAKEELAD